METGTRLGELQSGLVQQVTGLGGLQGQQLHDFSARMQQQLTEQPALDWMSEATRTQALAKLDAMRVKIGYPDRWRDWSGAFKSYGAWRGFLAGPWPS